MKKTVHMIGNAHLDPVWLWNWREGFQENKATMKSALDRLDEYDDFVYTCSSAQFYEWVEENAPDLFERIKQRVAEGRWVIVGGWWVQPDCNIPSGESFARHALISQNYFYEKFGVKAKTGYNVDSFGHNAMLPQILKKSGLENYVFMRPGRFEKPEIKDGPFIWEAPDGSQVNTFRIFDSYGNAGAVNESLGRCIEHFKDEPNDYMFFYGVGNHGGGPTIKLIEFIKKLQKEWKDDVNIVFSDPNTYFDAVDKSVLPVVKDDLQHHAAGCYAAESMIKYMNRKSENALLSAEKFSVMSEKLIGKDYSEPLTEAWKTVLFNQFHDILAGSSIRSAYYDARNQLGGAVAVANAAENRAMQAISFKINIPLDETVLPVVIFNPHGFSIKMPVELEVWGFPNGRSGSTATVLDKNGNKVPSQKVPSCTATTFRHAFTFMAEVPAYGYNVYFMKTESETEQTIDNSGEPVLENEILRVEFDKKTGGISSIFDKRTKREVLASSVKASVINDDTDTWGHTLVRLDDKVGEFEAFKIEVTDAGDTRKTVRVISKYGTSVLTQSYMLYQGDDKIRVKATVNWQEKRKALKLEFPVNTNDGKATVGIPFGHFEKKQDGKEEPMQMWADITADNVGLSVLNDGKYSVDFHDNTIGMTVVRSQVYAHHDPYVLDPDEEYMHIDVGVNDFAYSILPHDGAMKKSDIIKEAMLLNQPAVQMFETFHEGNLSMEDTFISVDKSNVVVSAIKKALKSDDTIIRLYEADGEDTTAEIKLFDTSFNASFKPYEIKTFALSEDGKVREVNLIEWDI